MTAPIPDSDARRAARESSARENERDTDQALVDGLRDLLDDT